MHHCPRRVQFKRNRTFPTGAGETYTIEGSLHLPRLHGGQYWYRACARVALPRHHLTRRTAAQPNKPDNLGRLPTAVSRSPRDLHLGIEA